MRTKSRHETSSWKRGGLRFNDGQDGLVRSKQLCWSKEAWVLCVRSPLPAVLPEPFNGVSLLNSKHVRWLCVPLHILFLLFRDMGHQKLPFAEEGERVSVPHLERHDERICLRDVLQKVRSRRCMTRWWQNNDMVYRKRQQVPPERWREQFNELGSEPGEDRKPA